MTQAEVYKQKAADPDYFRSSGDGLLFACLQAVATDKDFAIEEYIREDGQVFRNPAMAAGTHKLGPRESTISRDMFTGLLCYCLHFKRLDILETVWSYGWKHFWKMGQENQIIQIPVWKWTLRIRNNRVYFTPGLIILLAALIAHLRGRPKLATLLVNIWQPLGTTPGYPSHLTMLHIYLNRRLRGETSSSEYNVLHDILKHSPCNALALALFGAKRRAKEELLAQWPVDRLPTMEDWTEEWRTQRQDDDSGLVSGRPGDTRKHSGGDLLFVEHVLAL
jgi:hypothetical protein